MPGATNTPIKRDENLDLTTNPKMDKNLGGIYEGLELEPQTQTQQYNFPEPAVKLFEERYEIPVQSAESQDTNFFQTTNSNFNQSPNLETANLSSGFSDFTQDVQQEINSINQDRFNSNFSGEVGPNQIPEFAKDVSTENQIPQEIIEPIDKNLNKEVLNYDISSTVPETFTDELTQKPINIQPVLNPQTLKVEKQSEKIEPKLVIEKPEIPQTKIDLPEINLAPKNKEIVPEPKPEVISTSKIPESLKPENEKLVESKLEESPEIEVLIDPKVQNEKPEKPEPAQTFTKPKISETQNPETQISKPEFNLKPIKELKFQDVGVAPKNKSSEDENKETDDSVQKNSKLEEEVFETEKSVLKSSTFTTKITKPLKPTKPKKTTFKTNNPEYNLEKVVRPAWIQITNLLSTFLLDCDNIIYKNKNANILEVDFVNLAKSFDISKRNLNDLFKIHKDENSLSWSENSESLKRQIDLLKTSFDRLAGESDFFLKDSKNVSADKISNFRNSLLFFSSKLNVFFRENIQSAKVYIPEFEPEREEKKAEAKAENLVKVEQKEKPVTKEIPKMNINPVAVGGFVAAVGGAVVLDKVANEVGENDEPVITDASNAVGEEDPNTKIVDFSRQEEIPQNQAVETQPQVKEVLEQKRILPQVKNLEPIPDKKLIPELKPENPKKQVDKNDEPVITDASNAVGEEDPNTKIVDFSRQEEQSLVPQREPEIKSPAEISKPIQNQQLTPVLETETPKKETGENSESEITDDSVFTDSNKLQELKNSETAEEVILTSKEIPLGQQEQAEKPVTFSKPVKTIETEDQIFEPISNEKLQPNPETVVDKKFDENGEPEIGDSKILEGLENPESQEIISATRQTTPLDQSTENLTQVPVYHNSKETQIPVPAVALVRPISDQLLTPSLDTITKGSGLGDSQILQKTQGQNEQTSSQQSQTLSPATVFYPKAPTIYPETITQSFPQTESPNYSPTYTNYPQQTAVQSFSPSQIFPQADTRTANKNVLPAFGSLNTQSSQTGNLTAENQSSTSQTENLSLNSDNNSNISNIKTSSSTSENFTVNTPFNPQFQNHNSQDLVAEYGNPELNQDSKAVVFEEIKKRNAYYELLAQYLQEQIENSQNEAEKNRLENLLTKVILPELLPLATLSGLDLEIDEESLEKLTEDAKDEVKKLIEGYSDENSEAENEKNNLIKLAQNSQGLINIQPNFQDSDENIKKEEIKDGEEVNETSETADATVTIPEGGVLPEFVPLSENQEPEKLANLVRTVAAIGAMPEFHPLPRNSSGSVGNPEVTENPEIDNSQMTDSSGTEEENLDEGQSEQENEQNPDGEEEQEENTQTDSDVLQDSEAIRKRDNQDSGDNQENSEKDKKPNKLRQGIDNIKNKIDPRDVARRAAKRLKDKAIAKAAQLLAKLSLQSLWPIIIGILIVILVFVGLFGALFVTYCTPIEPLRSGIEARLYINSQVNKGKNATIVTTDAVVRVVINGITKIDVIPHSFLWKAFENLPGCTGVQQGTICPAGYVAWKNVNGKWVQGGTATAAGAGGNGGGGTPLCLENELNNKSDTDTIKLWRGNGGQVTQSDIPIKDIKSVINAGKEARVDTEVIAFVLSLMATESGGQENIWATDNRMGCYGVAQICSGDFGGYSYETWSQKALGKVPNPEDFKSDPAMQMKVIAVGYEDKRSLNAFPDKPPIYGASARWLGTGCEPVLYPGYTPTCDTDYGEAALRNYAIITCQKDLSKTVFNNNLEKTNQNVANNSNFNFLNVLSGNVDVLANGPGSFTYNGEDKKIIELINKGKIEDAITLVSPGRGSFENQIERKLVHPIVLKSMITIAENLNDYELFSMRIVSAYRDDSNTEHGLGEKIDIDAITTTDGITYAHADAFEGNPAAIEAWYNYAKLLKDVGTVDQIVTAGPIYQKLASSSEFPGISFLNDASQHWHHYDIRFVASGSVNDNLASGATVCCPPGAHPEGSVINNTNLSEDGTDGENNNLPAPDPNAKDGEKPKKYSEITQAHRDFIAKLAKESGYTLQNSDGNGILPDAQKDFDEMAIAAKAEKDLDLKIASGYRSREDQVGVFFGKINNVFAGNPNDPTVIADYLERMRLSAPPGYSEHQTGRGMDIVSQDPKTQDLDPQKWIGTDTEKWLAENSGRYGFRITYKKDRLNSTKGTTYEPWHLFYTGNKTSLNNTNFNPLDLFKNVSVRAEETKDTTKSELDLNKAAGTVSGFDGSIAVQEIDSNGKTIGNSSNYNGNQPPASPASSIKAVIADVIIKNNIDLNKKVTITEDMIYDQKSGSYQDKHFKVGESYTVKELLDKTLSVSSNTAPNALVSLVGGPGSGVNSKIKTLGYNNTEFNGYFNSEGGNKNTITALDFTKAMSNLWQNSTARSFLSKNNDKFKLPSLGNKDAGNDSVTGNSGVFNINGKNYIITVFHNGAGGAVCDDNGDCVGENDKFVTDTTKAIIDQLGGNVSTDPGSPTDGNTDITTINAGTGCGCIAAGSGSSDFGSGGGGAGGSIPISDCGEKLLQTITDIFIKFEAGERNNPINFTVTSLNDKIFTKTREKFTEAECKFSYTPRKDDPSILFANFDGPKGKECGEYATKVYLGDLFIPSFKDTETWGDAFEVFHPKKDAGNAAVYDQYLAAFKQVNLKIDGKEVPLTMDIKIGDLKKALSNTNCGSASNLQFNYLNQLANNNIFSPIPVSAEESATKTQNLTVNSSIIPINIRKVINQDLTDKKLDNTEVLGVRDLVNESLKSSNTTNIEKQNLQRLKQMLDVSVEYNKTIQATTSLENFELKLDNVTSEQLSKYPIAKSEGKNNLSTCPSIVGSGKVVKGTESFLKYVEQQATGKPALGRCFEKVADYIDAVGYGKLGGPNGTLVGDAMSQDGFPTGMARNFADWLNTGDNATKWGLKNILTKDMSPYNAPPGSIIVVSAGSPGTSDPVAGDITVRGIAFPDGVTAFYNDGEMGYNGPQQWNGANATNGIGKVLGVYVPIN